MSPEPTQIVGYSDLRPEPPLRLPVAKLQKTVYTPVNLLVVGIGSEKQFFR